MWSRLKLIFDSFGKKERKIFISASLLFIISFFSRSVIAFEENTEFVPASGGSYSEGAVGQPIAINPIISQNPIDEDLSALVYEKLFNLLSGYETLNNGRTYLLKLKEGLKWSDGAPLTTDDVVFTIKTVQDPETRSPIQKSWQGVVVERLSELQIQLALPAPYGFFIKNLERLPIIPRHIFGVLPAANLRLSSYNLEPVSSGFYKLEGLSKRKDGFISEYHFVPNENYSGEKANISDFYFKFYETEEGLLNAFRLREISGFGDLGPPSNLIDKIPNAAIEKIPMARYYAIFFNSNINPLLKKEDLRIALNAAVDKKKILSEVFGNSDYKLDQPLFLKNGALDENPLNNFNLEEAKARFEKIRMSGGQTSIELNLIVPEIDFLVRSAEIIKENWLALGIDKVNIISLNPDDLLNNALKARNYEMVLFGNVLENYLDLFPFWHSSQRFYPGLNLALYQNSKVDQILETIRQSEAPLAEREILLEEAALLISKDAPAIFLFSLPYTHVHTKNLQNFLVFEKNNFLVTPADRFKNANQWYVNSVRIVR